MHNLLRLAGVLASADVIFRMLSVVDEISDGAEKLANRLEEFEQILEEN